MAHKFERFYDMQLGGNGAQEPIPRLWSHILGTFFSGLCKIAFRYTIENQEIIKAFDGKKNGAVIVAPHVSYLDVIMMWLSVRPAQYVRLIARDSLFEALGSVLGFFIARVGAVPIQRDTADRVAIKRAARMLKNGELVGIFPEGTRRGKGHVEPDLHGGAALIARMGKAPLVPLGLVNVSSVKPKGKRMHFPKIRVVFGEPIAVSSFDFLPKDERLDGCVWYVLREALALSNECAPEDVDMCGLFPHSKNYADVFAHHEITRLDTSTLPDAKPSITSTQAKEQ